MSNKTLAVDTESDTSKSVSPDSYAIGADWESTRVPPYTWTAAYYKDIAGRRASDPHIHVQPEYIILHVSG